MSTLLISTNLGTIALATLPSAAPETVNHIVTLIQSKIYDNKTFYRSDFVIQLGLYGSHESNPYPDLPVNETHTNSIVSNTRGTMSVAHHDVPDNGNSEIFINLTENVHLDEAYGGYCVFAAINDNDKESYQTVDAIAARIAAAEGSTVSIQSVRMI